MPSATKIQDLLKRDLNEKIEEIIKVDQTDEETVYREITEYVATRSIRQSYDTLLRAIADFPSDPHESVGVWVSGFFGSGKSSFAKILGYVLANQTVRGHSAADLFKRQVNDEGISRLVDVINTRIPTEVVMFDVSVDRAVRNTNERIAEIIYTVLLRHLGYSTDFDIAELEIELESEGRLEEFERICMQRENQPWAKVRIGAQRINRASAILHAMSPSTYPAPDSWARSLAGRNADVSVKTVVDRAFTLTERRRPGKALTLIIDEVGQYVARSADKIEDLRALVEQFGKESRNRVRAGTAKAPIWVIVTSQEKLDEVVAALDSKRVELAKVQDRFKYRVDLAPADIREVATRRVLEKRPDAVPQLQQVFAAAQGKINESCRLERTKRKSEVHAEDFVQFYPYLPHFIELSIDIMSGIRLQPGAPRHLGGSNRTIIKQAHEMLISPRTDLATKHVGRLVTLDLIYELVEGNLTSEKQKDISDISERFKGDPHDGGWAERVGKAIALLEFVRDLPRTEQNIAAMLVAEAGASAPLPEVQAALERLQSAQFIRHTEEGYKLLTAQEKHWDDERKSYLDPKQRERNDLKRETLATIFGDTKLRTYRYHDLHNFKVNVTVDGMQIENGDIPLELLVGDDSEDTQEKHTQARSDSRSAKGREVVYYVFGLTPEIDTLIANLYASEQMITKYQQVGAQGERAAELGPLMESEKRERDRLKNRLRDKMEDAMTGGIGYFAGAGHDGSELGRTPPEIFRNLFEQAVPDLYPHLEMGARRLTGSEAEDVLKAANLNALPQVFYGGERGLELVVRDGGKVVPNVNAPIAQELLRYLKSEQQYGNRVTGKDLEKRFTGLGYGWDLDVIKLTLAVLLRAGSIEVTHQGRRYRNAQDPQSRAPLINNSAFRNASFNPRDSIDLRMLTTAVRNYEALTGDEVDVEEGAIAEALKKLVNEEITALLPVRAEVRANSLPGADVLNDYYQTLQNIQSAASDDCVRYLAGDGSALKEQRAHARRIREALTEHNVTAIRQARRSLQEQWPVLRARGAPADLAAAAEELQHLIVSDTLYESLPRVERLARDVRDAYARAYNNAHQERFERYSAAIDTLKGSVAWLSVPESAQAELLAPLTTRACDRDADLRDDASVCARCAATVSQIESDVAALSALSARVNADVQAFVAPSRNDAHDSARSVARVHAADFFTGALNTEQDVKEAIERIRDELYKLLAQGASIIVE